ncbi:MAG: DUF1501 domain-containing protein [Fimbriimonadales bacterium]|nr:DUF1501 domain-containing protein [Fimbriimonadales bacterium]
MSDQITRRDLLRKSAIIAIGAAAPPWLASIAKADVVKMAAGRKIDPDNILVVCQLSGGNDGLNTVVPYANSAYYAARPVLALKEEEVIKIDAEFGLHPTMNGFKSLYDEKKVAIIQSVGYPNPDRSHFKSMEIWQTANPDGREQYGWLGKYLDNQIQSGSTNPVMALGLSRTKPDALKAKVASVPCFASLADIKAFVGDPDAERMLREVQGMDAYGSADAEAVRKANLTALDAMAELNKALDSYTPKMPYGNDQFGQGFRQIAHLIATSPKTRVIYFAAGGFDTHSQQAAAHSRLVQDFSNALKAFMDEMKSLGKDGKVSVLVFSEFGRRVRENASAGTDHGAGAPMFIVGGKVKGGMYGEKPDLVNLDRGDVPWRVDFRQVYSTVMDQWMGGDSETMFGKKFNHVNIF